MPRVRSLITVLLLALWLPATLHCSLEQFEIFGDQPACADSCATDSCDLLENGLFKSNAATVHVGAPTLLACLWCPAEFVSEPIFVPDVSPDLTDCPPELARTWQFAVRAAPPPRAPSDLVS